MNENVTTKVLIGEARMSYVHVFQPDAINPTDEPKYSVSLIIPKSNTELVNKIRKAIDIATEAGKVSKFGGKIPRNLKTPLRDGDLERPEDDAYAGSYFISATTKSKPEVVKRGMVAGTLKFIQITDEEEFYSGCYGYASVNFFAFNNRGNVGIAAGLNNILKTRDGEYLGGKVSAATDFADMLEAEDDLPEGDDIY